MPKRPLCGAFLRHMHHPDYRRTRGGNPSAVGQALCGRIRRSIPHPREACLQAGGRIPPLSFDEPIRKIPAGFPHRNPVRAFTPQPDGIVGGGFEWLSGCFAVPGRRESMHRTERLVDKVIAGIRCAGHLPADRFGTGEDRSFPPAGSIRGQCTSPEKCCLAAECTENRA
jgi:hypothetical protein